MQNAKHALCNDHVLRGVHFPRVRILAYTPRLSLVPADARYSSAHLRAAREHDCSIKDMVGTSYRATGRRWSYIRFVLHTTRVQTLDAWIERVWPLGGGFCPHVYPHLDLPYTSLDILSGTQNACRIGRANTTTREACNNYLVSLLLRLILRLALALPKRLTLKSGARLILRLRLPPRLRCAAVAVAVAVAVDVAGTRARGGAAPRVDVDHETTHVCGGVSKKSFP